MKNKVFTVVDDAEIVLFPSLNVNKRNKNSEHNFFMKSQIFVVYRKTTKQFDYIFTNSRINTNKCVCKHTNENTRFFKSLTQMNSPEEISMLFCISRKSNINNLDLSNQNIDSLISKAVILLDTHFK